MSHYQCPDNYEERRLTYLTKYYTPRHKGTKNLQLRGNKNKDLHN